MYAILHESMKYQCLIPEIFRPHSNHAQGFRIGVLCQPQFDFFAYTHPSWTCLEWRVFKGIRALVASLKIYDF